MADCDALDDALDAALDKFWAVREIFKLDDADHNAISRGLFRERTGLPCCSHEDDTRTWD